MEPSIYLLPTHLLPLYIALVRSKCDLEGLLTEDGEDREWYHNTLLEFSK